jgi:hypothetical protein
LQAASAVAAQRRRWRRSVGGGGAASAVAAQLRGAKALPDRFRASEGERENFC